MKNGPKNLKFKKIRKGKLKKFELKSNLLKFGSVGLKALESGTLTSNQIESVRQVIAKKTNRRSKIWIKIFTYTPITSKSVGVRMGKGKGKLTHWGAKISKGCVLFEICGSNLKLLISSLISCKSKLPIKTTICYKKLLWLTKTK